MQSVIRSITSYLPGPAITNADLSRSFPEWSVDRIAEKTGIHERHIAGASECSSDLAFEAAQKLFATGVCKPGDIDYVLLCTQSPDYFLPTTACLLQQRLGIPKQAGALDFNLGCSGYVYGLGLAHGLVSTGQASCILFLTGETYSKFIEPSDKSSLTIFGDGGTATLIEADAQDQSLRRAAYVYGTDGAGADQLIIRSGGMRQRTPVGPGENSQPSRADFLWMNGPEVFHFALAVVPGCVRKLLEQSGLHMEDIDLFVFHQANRYMLDHLRSRLGIAEEKFYVSLSSCGNTVSGTIPLALESALADSRLRPGMTVMLVGFGVGLSWGATLLSWPYLGAPLPTASAGAQV